MTASPPPPLPPEPPERRRPAPVSPLDYGHPPGPGDQTPPPPVTFSPAIFLLTAGATSVVVILLGFVVPRLETVFRDFGTKLPAVTELVLGVSRLFTRTPVWLTGPVIVLGVATAAAMIPLPRRAVRLLITMILALIVLAFALAILLPLVNLMTSVSSPRH